MSPREGPASCQTQPCPSNRTLSLPKRWAFKHRVQRVQRANAPPPDPPCQAPFGASAGRGERVQVLSRPQIRSRSSSRQLPPGSAQKLPADGKCLVPAGTALSNSPALSAWTAAVTGAGSALGWGPATGLDLGDRGGGGRSQQHLLVGGRARIVKIWVSRASWKAESLERVAGCEA